MKKLFLDIGGISTPPSMWVKNSGISLSLKEIEQITESCILVVGYSDQIQIFKINEGNLVRYSTKITNICKNKQEIENHINSTLESVFGISILATKIS